MDLKTGVLFGSIVTISVAVAIILATKYQEKQIAKKASSANA